MEATVAIAGLALVVSFLGLLLNAAKGNRDAHGSTEDRARAQERRDTNLERDARETKAAVARIESALKVSMEGLQKQLKETDEKLTGRLDGLAEKLDSANQRLARAEARMTALEDRQNRTDDDIRGLYNMAASFFGMSVKEDQEAAEKGDGNHEAMVAGRRNQGA